MLVEPGAAEWARIAARMPDQSHEQTHAFAAHAAAASRARLAAVVALEKGALEGGEPAGAACVRVKPVPLLGRGIAYVSAGPLVAGGDAEYPERLAAVLEALAERFVRREGHVLRLRLPVMRAVAGGGGTADDVLRGMGFAPAPLARSYRTVLVDLAQDEAGLRKALDPKWRYELNRAAKAGQEIEAGRSRAHVERFLALYAAMREFKSFETGVDPAILLDLMETEFDFEVLVARREGEDAGAVAVCRTPACATYLLGATTEAGRELRSGYLLTWTAMLRARAAGIRWYDLGGIDEAENPEGARYKRRTGGAEVQASGPWELRPRGLAAPLIRAAEAVYRARARG